VSAPRSGWDRTDANEWAEPKLPDVRPWVFVIAVALIIVGSLLAIVGSVPGAFNGASLAFVLAIGGSITMAVREVRR
jgi:hypothetical protein